MLYHKYITWQTLTLYFSVTTSLHALDLIWTWFRTGLDQVWFKSTISHANIQQLLFSVNLCEILPHSATCTPVSVLLLYVYLYLSTTCECRSWSQNKAALYTRTESECFTEQQAWLRTINVQITHKTRVPNVFVACN